MLNNIRLVYLENNYNGLSIDWKSGLKIFFLHIAACELVNINIQPSYLSPRDPVSFFLLLLGYYWLAKRDIDHKSLASISRTVICKIQRLYGSLQ